MRKLDSAVVVRTLCFVIAGAAVASPMACSTTDTATPAEDGGVGADGGPIVEPPKPCEKNADCASGVCNTTKKLCEPPTCTDAVKNGKESDLDCGGDCPKCDVGKTCAAGPDCAQGVCTDTGEGLKCQPPTNTDGVKNGNETGIDCGGNGNEKCPDGQGCLTQDDCANDFCNVKNFCSATNPPDGMKDGTETDVDCGGVGNVRCADLKACLIAADCKSSVCTGNVCQVPTYTDGVKNGTETDKDCGGDVAGANGCATDAACLVANDCVSRGCNYAKKCVPARSCVARYGGDTCGLGGAGGVGAAAWESCCTALPVTTANGGTVYMDKYPTTAGRYRVFLEAVGYNVRAFVQQARADGKIPKLPEKFNLTPDGVNTALDPTWDPYLPTSFAGNGAGELSEGSQTCTGLNGAPPCAEGPAQPGIYTAVRNHLGGNIFRSNSQTSTGCFTDSPGTHSFRFPDAQHDSVTKPDYPVEVYDTKTLNCVDYLMAQAFCVWDGGRLETFSEWQAAWGAGALPWSATDPRPPEGQVSNTSHYSRFPTATDADQSTVYTGAPAPGPQTWDPLTKTIEFANYTYSYEYPFLVNTDYIVYLTPPGRLRGRGPLGHSDVIGGGFELTSSVNYAAGIAGNRDSGVFAARHRWSGNGSWEGHGYDKNYGGATMLLNKYGKLGMRCVRFTP